jgi:hypothetical protein
MNRTVALEILERLNVLIIDNLMACAQEQYEPSHGPDLMDDKIKYHFEKAESLRVIRSNFEEVMTGVIVPQKQIVTFDVNSLKEAIHNEDF